MKSFLVRIHDTRDCRYIIPKGSWTYFLFNGLIPLFIYFFLVGGIDDELTILMRKMSASEQKWLVRMLLKDMKLGIGNNKILSTFHRDAVDLYDVSNCLKKVSLRKRFSTNSIQYPRAKRYLPNSHFWKNQVCVVLEISNNSSLCVENLIVLSYVSYEIQNFKNCDLHWNQWGQSTDFLWYLGMTKTGLGTFWLWGTEFILQSRTRPGTSIQIGF